MNRKITSTLIALLASTALFAQNREEKWNVYDLQTPQNTTIIDLAERVEPKAIVGEDNRIDITGRATDFEKAAVVLEMTNGRNRFLCSGSMIGKNMVLTAAHCLTNNGIPFPTVQVFATGLSTNNSAQNLPSPTENLQALLTEFLRRHPGHAINFSRQQTINLNNKRAVNVPSNGKNFPSASAIELWIPEEWDDRKPLQAIEPFDYGIVILDQNLGEKTGWLNIASKSTKELKGKNIILLGRGGDKPSRTLWRAEGVAGIVDNLYLYHNADMVGGNSGGPVVLETDPYTIVALNNFGPIQEHSREGTFPNGCLRISNKIINAVEHITK